MKSLIDNQDSLKSMVVKKPCWRGIVMRKLLILLIAISILVFASPPSFADWLVFHKPAFQGKVIDAETKEPIEGAVAVAIYNKKTIGIAESYTVIIDVKEILTDKNGEFHFPSYTNIIQPLSWEYVTDFIIYKPGYGNFPNGRVYPIKGMDIGFEDFFSGGIGVAKEVLFREPWKAGAESTKMKAVLGVVELPKLMTKGERKENIPSITLFEFLVNQINLMRLIHDEEDFLGLERTDPFKTREFIFE
ncbi:MAG: hypothetical protein HY954_13210 [Deltaproteobacteria bacterium]|nr:hypothetical protein [Deltaproteobacteria bacterium]